MSNSLIEGIFGNRVFFSFGNEIISFAHPEPQGQNDSLAYELIHSERELTRNERLRLAAIIESYSHLINRETNQSRNKKANAIKRVLKGEKL